MTARPASDLKPQLIAWQQNRAATPLLHASLTLLQVCLWVAAISCWHRGWWWTLGAVWMAAIVVVHNKLVAFHEAAHGQLQPVRRLNEFIGQLLGCVMMVPLTAFRIVHQQHHAYLGTERDVEFWPFVDPSVSRWRRVAAFVGEVGFAYFYAPVVFFRGVCVAREIPPLQRRRAFREYAVCGGVWLSLAVLFTWQGWWPEFVVAFFIPGYIAASLNALRRMIEHLGMLGDSLETKTRTIVPAGAAEAAISAASLRINYHATHHRYGRVPYYHLPEATQRVYGDDLRRMPVFATYWSAFRDMLPHVVDPRIGGQWLKRDAAPSVRVRG